VVWIAVACRHPTVIGLAQECHRSEALRLYGYETGKSPRGLWPPSDRRGLFSGEPRLAYHRCNGNPGGRSELLLQRHRFHWASAASASSRRKCAAFPLGATTPRADAGNPRSNERQLAGITDKDIRIESSEVFRHELQLIERISVDVDACAVWTNACQLCSQLFSSRCRALGLGRFPNETQREQCDQGTKRERFFADLHRSHPMMDPRQTVCRERVNLWFTLKARKVRANPREDDAGACFCLRNGRSI